MEINKHNQNIAGKGEIYFHDLLISLFDFDVKNRELCMIISDYHVDKFNLKFKNVFDFLFTRRIFDSNDQGNSIFDWAEIPNDATKDNYLYEVKDTFISNGGEWNDELFAVSFLLRDISRIKVICEKIIVEQITNV